MEVKFDAIQGVVREKDTPVVTAGNITYKGTKATVADLPQTGNTQGDMWRITADGSEYYWNGTQWEFMGKQVTVDSALDANSTNAVQNAVVTQALNSIVTCMPIPSEAVINGTTLAFCESLAASGKDKAGMMFLGSVRITDTPPGGQADMKVEIISKPAHPEAPQDNDFDTVYRLELNSTNTKERSWVTMYFKSRWPSAVGSPSGNPKAQGWYERVSNQYHLTEDTEVQTGKTYYALQAGSMCYGTTDCPWFSSLMAPAVSGYDSKTKCGSELNKQYRAATEQYVDNAVNTKISTPANPVTGQYLKKTADGWVTDEVTGGVSDVKVNSVSIVDANGVADFDSTVIAGMAGQAAATAVAEVIPLAPCTGITVVYGSGSNTITFSDPADITTTGLTISWAKTRLVRKENAYPTSYNDGVTIVDNTVRNQYMTTGYTDSTADPTKTYRYALFSQTNTGAWNSWTQNRVPYPSTDHLGAVTHTSIRYGLNAVTLKWREPNDVSDDGYVFLKWARTFIIRKEGSYPTALNDGTMVAATSLNWQTDTYPYPTGITPKEKYWYYENAFEDTGLTSGVTYYYRAFNMDGVGLIQTLEEDKLPYYTSMTPEMLAYYTRLGQASSVVSLGDSLDFEHTEYPGLGAVVSGFDCVEPWDTSKTHSLDLLMEYIPFQDTFSQNCATWGRNENCTKWNADTAFVANHTYGILLNGSYVQLTSGTHYLPGETTATYDGVTYNIADIYVKTPESTDNNPEFSLPVLWGNSDQPAAQWFAKPHPFSVSSTSWNARNGFMYNLPSGWKNAIMEVKQYHANPIAGWRNFFNWSASSCTYYKTKMYLPTKKHIYDATGEGGMVEGKKMFDCFTNQPNSARIRYMLNARSVAAAWWLGSPYNNAIRSYQVSASGASVGRNVYHGYGVLLGCSLG